MISVYVAARFETQADARKLRDQLAQHGIGCTSRWLEEEPSLGEIPEETKRRVAAYDAYDVRRAQAVVFWNPPEKHRTGTGGCHVEVGMALAMGIPVFVVGGGSNVFHWMQGVQRHVEPNGTDVNRSAFMDSLVYAIRSKCEEFGPTWDSPYEQTQKADEVTQEKGVVPSDCQHARVTPEVGGPRTCDDCGALVGGVAP